MSQFLGLRTNTHGMKFDHYCLQFVGTEVVRVNINVRNTFIFVMLLSISILGVTAYISYLSVYELPYEKIKVLTMLYCIALSISSIVHYFASCCCRYPIILFLPLVVPFASSIYHLILLSSL